MKTEEIKKEAEKLCEAWGMQDGNGYGVKDAYQVGFVQGALKYTELVWHNMKSEEPQVYGVYENEIYPQIPCLVFGKLSTGYGYGVRYWNVTEKCFDDEECDDFECNKDDIVEWAYLDDLLPNKESA